MKGTVERIRVHAAEARIVVRRHGHVEIECAMPHNSTLTMLVDLREAGTPAGGCVDLRVLLPAGVRLNVELVVACESTADVPDLCVAFRALGDWPAPPSAVLSPANPASLASIRQLVSIDCRVHVVSVKFSENDLREFDATWRSKTVAISQLGARSEVSLDSTAAVAWGRPGVEHRSQHADWAIDIPPGAVFIPIATIVGATAVGLGLFSEVLYGQFGVSPVEVGQSHERLLWQAAGLSLLPVATAVGTLFVTTRNERRSDRNPAWFLPINVGLLVLILQLCIAVLNEPRFSLVRLIATIALMFGVVSLFSLSRIGRKTRKRRFFAAVLATGLLLSQMYVLLYAIASRMGFEYQTSALLGEGHGLSVYPGVELFRTAVVEVSADEQTTEALLSNVPHDRGDVAARPDVRTFCLLWLGQNDGVHVFLANPNGSGAANSVYRLSAEDVVVRDSILGSSLADLSCDRISWVSGTGSGP